MEVHVSDARTPQPPRHGRDFEEQRMSGPVVFAAEPAARKVFGVQVARDADAELR
jgi:hypothetical protein